MLRFTQNSAIIARDQLIKSHILHSHPRQPFRYRSKFVVPEYAACRDGRIAVIEDQVHTVGVRPIELLVLGDALLV
ncbi:MAG: hypothetical protein LBK41_06925, partial [Clostridiales bacterium]|nr:hypothetical protein [Clostridiales bacterium]